MRFLAVFLLALLLGCTSEVGESNGGESVVGNKTLVCRNITYESYDCPTMSFNYTVDDFRKEDPYKMDVFCVGAASLRLNNLEEEQGDYRVTFVFRTGIEGEVKKSVEHSIAPRSSAEFKEQVQFRCSQEYDVSFRVSAPVKRQCIRVNKTREECLMG